MLLQVGCAPKSAPAIGAERVFEQKLKPDRHPQQLFNKKERKEMRRMGMLPSDDGHRGATAAPVAAPSKAPAGVPVKDTSTTIRL
ncbi:hypothetical protein CK934_16025 [Chitinophaga sp. MD30]|nr:hypothetical protein CK934_16025 [Chitinophaga sp. MD30]